MSFPRSFAYRVYEILHFLAHSLLGSRRVIQIGGHLMYFLHKLKFAILSFLFSLLILPGSFASAKPAAKQSQTTQRQNMADYHSKMAHIHSRMALCLESDKALSDCRSEMRDQCKNNFGDDCTMMGNGFMGGQGRGRGMMNRGCMDWMTSP